MQNLIRFIRMYNFLLLFLLFQSISLILINNNNSYQNYRILKKTSEYTGFIYSTSHTVKEYFQLKESNKYLANENAKLLTIINSIDRKTNIQEEEKEFNFISSQVINNTVNKRNNYITLNKGSNHGIKEGMGVVTLNGVVGIIHSVSNKFSLVMSILNKKSSISVKLNKQNNSGSLKWKGFNYRKASLESIPNHVKINSNDTISTNGYSTIFPKGINIGIINSYKSNSETGHYDIMIDLFTDFNKLSSVYIIKSIDALEQLNLEKSNND